MSDLVAWLLAQPAGREQLALLALCSVSAYAVAGSLWHRLAGRLEGRWAGRLVVEAARLCFYVGLPAAALWRGDLYASMGIPTTLAGDWASSPRTLLLALTMTRTVGDLARGAALSVGTMALLLGLWTWYARVTRVAEDEGQPAPWWEAAREAVYAQLYWAFCRAVVAQWLDASGYAAFGGLALVGASWALNPLRRNRVGVSVVADWVMALCTALVAIWVNSLIWLVPLHFCWHWASSHILYAIQRGQASAAGFAQREGADHGVQS